MSKKLIIAIVCNLLLLSLGAFAVATERSAPTIAVYPDIYYPLDEVLYLEGRSHPLIAVLINFQKQGAKPLNFTTKSDANGEWVLAEKVPLESGDWEVRARENITQDILSEWSNPRVIKALVSGVVIGGIGIKFALLALIIFALLVASGFVFWYFSIRVKQLRAIIAQKELREAHESVRSSFTEIRQDLLDEMKRFNEAGRQLSPEETQRKEHILRELDQLEHATEKEIQDIEKYVE